MNIIRHCRAGLLALLFASSAFAGTPRYEAHPHPVGHGIWILTLPDAPIRTLEEWQHAYQDFITAHSADFNATTQIGLRRGSRSPMHALQIYTRPLRAIQ